MPDETRQRAEVILVHGLWDRGYSMLLLASRLRSMGWPVRLFSYPSVSRDLSRSADKLRKMINNSRYPNVYVVAHSLGGLISLLARSMHGADKLQRMVLLGTPLTGSKVAQRLASLPILNRTLGHSKKLLLNGSNELPAGAVVGVLAGNRSVGLGKLISPTSEANDGTVMVSETHLPELQDHLVLPASHTGMLFSRQLVQQTDHFLRYGCFSRNEMV